MEVIEGLHSSLFKSLHEMKHLFRFSESRILYYGIISTIVTVTVITECILNTETVVQFLKSEQKQFEIFIYCTQ